MLSEPATGRVRVLETQYCEASPNHYRGEDSLDTSPEQSCIQFGPKTSNAFKFAASQNFAPESEAARLVYCESSIGLTENKQKPLQGSRSTSLLIARVGLCVGRKCKSKTYNSEDSPVVTHLSTNFRRSVTWVSQSGRDAPFFTDCGRTCWNGVSVEIRYLILARCDEEELRLDGQRRG